jgi:pilus assembly protein CpaF
MSPGETPSVTDAQAGPAPHGGASDPEGAEPVAESTAASGEEPATDPARSAEPVQAPPSPVAPAQAPAATAARPPATTAQTTREAFLREIRIRLQSAVGNTSSSLLDAPPEELRGRVEGIVDRIVRTNGFAVTHGERQRLIEELTGEVSGFGPIEPYLKDETITEVMVNGPRQIYIERRGKIEKVERTFLNDEHVLRIIDRIITPLGRRVDQTSPRVDARLPDGSRVNAIIPPLSLVGPVITIRKFAAKPFTVDDLVSFGTATAEMFDFLRACVEARLNVFVSGGTGSGKTTTLNVISAFIPSDERIITIEDAAELQLRQPHVVTLESRPPNLEGRGEITIRDLLRNSLHMRPDRIIVGECRAGEALDMVQAMTVGQDGSLSTGHANSPRDMLSRLETMILMAGVDLPLRAIREQIASAVDLIVHTARLKDGSRKIVNITEVYGIEEDDILTQDIFEFEQTDFRDGRIYGELKPTGIRPTFMPKFKSAGIELPPGEFGIPPEDPANPDLSRQRKGRWLAGEQLDTGEGARTTLGRGRVVRAGGMVYASGIGPVDLETGRVVPGGIKEHAAQCLRNLQALLEGEGSSLERIAWASWSLRDAAEYDVFAEEWARWFPGDQPVGQTTLMPSLQRRAGFRISLGVIAEA